MEMTESTATEIEIEKLMVEINGSKGGVMNAKHSRGN